MPTRTTAADEDLRDALARLGVPLLRERRGPPAGDLPAADYAVLLRRLVEADDARLNASIPCLLALWDGAAARQAVLSVAEDPRLRARLGFLHRLSRALVLSRRPDLERILRRTPVLEALSIEPADLVDPSDQDGDTTLWRASERARARGEPDLAGDVVSSFDTWLRLLAVERRDDRA